MCPQALIFDQFGLKHLRIQTYDPPKLTPKQVRVRPQVASLNYRDLLMVTGQYNPKLKLPLIPCSDGAGEVIEVGSAVTDLKVGDRVCSTMIPDWDQGEPSPELLKTTLGGPINGLLATQVILPQQAWLKIPHTMSYQTAACLPVAGLTAWTALTAFAQIGPESKVLLLGTGGVSMMALQIAKTMGAHIAITSGSDEKLARAQSLGANWGINYRKDPKWWKKVLEWAPSGVDVVVEVGGAGTFNQSVKSVRVGGKIGLIGVLAQNQEPVQLVPILMKNICVQGILVGHRQAFRDYIQFIAQHALEPVIDHVFQGLSEAVTAFETMKEGRHFGKLIINLGQ